MLSHIYPFYYLITIVQRLQRIKKYLNINVGDTGNITLASGYRNHLEWCLEPLPVYPEGMESARTVYQVWPAHREPPSPGGRMEKLSRPYNGQTIYHRSVIHIKHVITHTAKHHSHTHPIYGWQLSKSHGLTSNPEVTDSEYSAPLRRSTQPKQGVTQHHTQIHTRGHT